MPAPMPTPYESTAIKAIHSWKHPTLGWFDRALQVVNAPFEVAGDLAMKVPGVEWVIENCDVLLYNLTQREADQLETFDDLREFKRERGHDLFVFVKAEGKWRAVWRAMLPSASG